MKASIALLMIIISSMTQANCSKELQKAKNNDSSTLIITFDGLATAELKMKLLQRKFVKKAKKRCGKKQIASADFYYSKSGARKAIACAESFKKEFGSSLKVNIVGHSYGAGKGVFNFLELAAKKSIEVDNAITFDPRGNSYKYTNPGAGVVNHFVNIYQKTPLAGMKVSGADFEINVTGKSTHVSLPRKFSKLALDKSRGSLNCR